MAPIKLIRVISVSSEDERYPAESLLKPEVGSAQWKCKEVGEKQAVIVLQLEKESIISSVDVGNNNSAFIEILVSKTALPDEFKVLLPASTLMTVQESKNKENTTGVKFFKYEQFLKPTVEEAWDRIKIVCSQPFNKDVTYGLSFIKVYTKNQVLPADSSLGRFSLKVDDKDDKLSAGSLFERTRILQETTAAAIKEAVQARIEREKAASLNKIEKEKTAPSSSSSYTKRIPSPKSPSLKKDDSSNKNSIANSKPSTKNDENKLKAQKRKQDEAPKAGCSKKDKKEDKEIKRKPFSKLMEGVVFVLSGFQNPFRNTLREKALAMGARYRVDWDSTCTHLICAFMNTPKYKQVKGKGRILKNEWIIDSYGQRKKLSWKKYLLDKSDYRSDLSDDEIWEEQKRIFQSDSISDDERSTRAGADDIYDADTDID